VKGEKEDVAPRLITMWSNLCIEIGGRETIDVLNECIRRMLATPNLAAKEWVWRQYDHMVRTNTVVLPGSDAAVIRVKETRKSLAMSLDGNGRYCRLNPREGARLAVVEAARNVVCSGARPLAVTNCLNFASPERPEVMRAFSDTIDGIAEACYALDTPVTGGNVSFYNETEGKGIYPTPVIGMLGVVENARQVTTQWFKETGDQILLLGRTDNDLGASELLAGLAGYDGGSVPRLDLRAEAAVQRVCLRAIESGFVSSAHDCSDGGLAVALAESCFSHYRKDRIGARIDLGTHLDLSPIRNLEDQTVKTLALLFAESPSRIVLSVHPGCVESITAIANSEGVPCSLIGDVRGDRLTIAVHGELVVDQAVIAIEKCSRGALPAHLERVNTLAAD
jgi:phosphoribosylformylglycinamidine synthase